MIQKTKISINLPGIVIFDPIVVNEFVMENKIKDTDLFRHFINHPIIGDIAIKKGIILPVYSITEWDYKIILNTEINSSINQEWKLYVIEKEFPLQVKGNKIIVSDIYSIMNWDPDYYLNFPSKETRCGVDDDFELESGLYSIRILGFRDKNNPDIETRDCGFEFLTQKVECLPDISNINIDDFNFKVDGYADDSN